MTRAAAITTVLLAIALAWAPSARADGPLTTRAEAVVAQMPATVGGPAIAVLTRSDGDLNGFYYAAMKTLCATAPDYNWCDQDLVASLPDTTNQLGWARILTYTSTATQTQKTVCVVLPPSQGVSATTIATGISNGAAVFDWRDLATQDEALAWMWLHYGGICQSSGSGSEADTKAADAFASLALTLMEGSPAFVAAQDVSPSRKFSFYDGMASTAWATNVGERILLELWKGQATSILAAGGCQVSDVASQDMNTPGIQRATMLTQGADCNPNSDGSRYGQVSDSNLWLWSANGGGFAANWATVPLPPKPYSAFGSFPNQAAGIKYSWTTARSLAAQY